MTDEPEVFELHDPLAEDIQRLVDTWGLATLIHGVFAHVRNAALIADETERARLDVVADKLDIAWCEAEGGER